MNDEQQPPCEGHNWEIGQIMPEWTSNAGNAGSYRGVAIVICSFCGIVRKTIIKKL